MENITKGKINTESAKDIKKSHSWKGDYPLYDFYYKLKGVPDGWEEFFNKKEVKNEIRKISNEITKKLEKNPELKIYPKKYNVFKAFELTPIEKMRIYAGFQDPYYNPGAAQGVALSVGTPDNINPSLMNILRKVEREIYPVKHKYFMDNNLRIKSKALDGSLFHWAKQGVFLINAALTVEKGNPNSHAVLWKKFFNLLVEYISEYLITNNKFVIYLLMGKFSQSILPKIIDGDNEIIACSHPSPLGCNKKCGEFPSFNDTQIFSKINEMLKSREEEVIEW